MNRQPKKGTMKAMYMVTMGFLSAILLIGQVGMAALPNIEPVTMLIIVYTLIYRKQVFYIIYTFVILEGLIYGFGIWWFSYLYIWTILAVIVLLMKKTSRFLCGWWWQALMVLPLDFYVPFHILFQEAGAQELLIGCQESLMTLYIVLEIRC